MASERCASRPRGCAIAPFECCGDHIRKRKRHAANIEWLNGPVDVLDGIIESDIEAVVALHHVPIDAIEIGVGRLWGWINVL